MSDIVERLKEFLSEPDDVKEFVIASLTKGQLDVLRTFLGQETTAAEIERLRAERDEAWNAAIEEAAKYHDTQVQSYTQQIAVNDAYLARGGKLSSGSRANEYCDDQRATHRRSASAIRALSRDGTGMSEISSKHLEWTRDAPRSWPMRASGCIVSYTISRLSPKTFHVITDGRRNEAWPNTLEEAVAMADKWEEYDKEIMASPALMARLWRWR